MFLESQLHEDKSVTDLLTANYTFLNERLAAFYGVPNVYGARFRRVTMTDPNRMGLLGQGSILTVTSYSTRTSPVVRGKWLLSNILGSPPPAPPPNMPALVEAGEGGAPPSTVRERMASAPEERGVRQLPQPHRPDGLRAREFQRHRPLADDRVRVAD